MYDKNTKIKLIQSLEIKHYKKSFINIGCHFSSTVVIM